MRFGQTGVVKRSTAIRHLVEVAEAASDRMQLRATDIGWPLEELWVTGTLLDPIDELEHGSVVLMINLPPDEMPWLAVHPTAEWIGDQLRLGKRPLWWSYRPTAWPPWTYRDRRVARFWSAISGLDDEAIDALNTGRPTAVVEPDRDELLDQLDVELPVAKAHLRSILDPATGTRNGEEPTATTQAPKTSSGAPPAPSLRSRQPSTNRPADRRHYRALRNGHSAGYRALSVRTCAAITGWVVSDIEPANSDARRRDIRTRYSDTRGWPRVRQSGAVPASSNPSARERPAVRIRVWPAVSWWAMAGGHGRDPNSD
jgi:hypothetical protein